MWLWSAYDLGLHTLFMLTQSAERNWRRGWCNLRCNVIKQISSKPRYVRLSSVSTCHARWALVLLHSTLVLSVILSFSFIASSVSGRYTFEESFNEHDTRHDTGDYFNHLSCRWISSFPREPIQNKSTSKLACDECLRWPKFQPAIIIELYRPLICIKFPKWCAGRPHSIFNSRKNRKKPCNLWCECSANFNDRIECPLGCQRYKLRIRYFRNKYRRHGKSPNKRPAVI